MAMPRSRHFRAQTNPVFGLPLTSLILLTSRTLYFRRSSVSKKALKLADEALSHGVMRSRSFGNQPRQSMAGVPKRRLRLLGTMTELFVCGCHEAQYHSG